MSTEGDEILCLIIICIVHFSADCSVSMESMVIGAIEKGLQEICFTEHIDYEYPDETIVFEFDLHAYDEK